MGDIFTPQDKAGISCVCLFVCVSVTRRFCDETAERIQLILAQKLFLTYATFYFKKSQVSPEIRHFSLKIPSKLWT